MTQFRMKRLNCLTSRLVLKIIEIKNLKFPINISISVFVERATDYLAVCEEKKVLWKYKCKFISYFIANF